MRQSNFVKTYKSFQEAYLDLTEMVMTKGTEMTVRGLKVKEIMPYNFAISNPRDRLLNLECRKNMYRYIFGELMWYLSGNDRVDFISEYAKFWEHISDDECHSNSAYGKYIFRPMKRKGEGIIYDEYDSKNPEGMSQWEFCKTLLRDDPNTRQAVIHIKPIQMYNTADTVCTMYLHFMCRNNKLDLHVSMRSNDVIRGTCYDVFMFTFLQELMAKELGLKVGTYYHHADNIHIYETDYDKANEIIAELKTNKTRKMLSEIPDDFIMNDLSLLLMIEGALRQTSKLGKELVLMALHAEAFYDKTT